MRSAALLIGAFLVSTMVSAPAEAYRYRTCNGIPLKLQSNNHTARGNDFSFPAAGGWWNGLQYSINQFNHVPSNFYYTLVHDTGGLGLGNGQSEVWGSTDASVLQGAPAIAYSYWQCWWSPFTGTVAYMTEGDVIFDYANGAAAWTPGTSKSTLIRYGGSKRSLPGTAAHEFGHATGLLHVNTIYNIMGADFTHIHANGATANAYVGEDAGNGSVFLYGLWNAGPQDLAVQHWKYLGASGEYSTHTRTQMFTSSGGGLSSTTISEEPRYNVKRNQLVRVQFTFENNGRATSTGVVIRFYTSTNHLITSGDRLIGTVTGATLARDVPSTWTYTVRIPNNLTLFGNYWLGAIVSGSGDARSYNNASYIRIRVVP